MENNPGHRRKPPNRHCSKRIKNRMVYGSKNVRCSCTYVIVSRLKKNPITPVKYGKTRDSGSGTVATRLFDYSEWLRWATVLQQLAHTRVVKCHSFGVIARTARFDGKETVVKKKPWAYDLLLIQASTISKSKLSFSVTNIIIERTYVNCIVYLIEFSNSLRPVPLTQRNPRVPRRLI